MNAPALPKAPELAARWVRALVALAVTVPIGLAPLLGKFDVPGFTTLLSLFPPALRNEALAYATFTMGLVAVGVQFFGGEITSGRRLRRAFVVLAASLLLLLVTLAYQHSLHVVTVHLGPRQVPVAYVVGSERLHDCSCPPGTGDVQCLVQIGLDPSYRSSCWSEADLRSQEFLLVMLYVALMAGIGALVGLLVLKPPKRPRCRR